MTQQEQVNNIGRVLGSMLLNQGAKMLNSAFYLEPQIYNLVQLAHLWAKTGLAPSMFDNKYKVIDDDTWRTIIKYDWMAFQRAWLEDYSDCDNLAFSFASRMSTIYTLNTAGVARCDLYDPRTGQWLGGHLYNIILTRDNAGLKLMAYEPIKNIYVEYANEMVIDGWKYGVPTWIYFF